MSHEDLQRIYPQNSTQGNLKIRKNCIIQTFPENSHHQVMLNSLISRKFNRGFPPIDHYVTYSKIHFDSISHGMLSQMNLSDYGYSLGMRDRKSKCNGRKVTHISRKTEIL